MTTPPSQTKPALCPQVETQSDYFAPMRFGQAVTAGIRLARLGSSNVRCAAAVFAGAARYPCPRI